MSSESSVVIKRSKKLFCRKKVGGVITKRRGKPYGSVKLKPKNRKCPGIFESSAPWSSDEMDAGDKTGRRKSEILERDTFLELLSKVQDNRYNNQRYTIKAGSMTDENNADDVFEESKSGRSRSSSVKAVANGVIPNGSSALFSKKGPRDIPSVKITDSPLHRRVQKSASVGSISVVSEDSSRSPDEGRPSSAGSKERDLSMSPTQSSATESVMSPSKKTMDVLKKMIDTDGPYPLLIQPPCGGYWIQNGDYEVAHGEDGVWRAPEISTEHYTLQADKTAFVYGRYFRKQVHQNYVARDSKRGPVILSLKLEEDYQGTLARVLLRTQKETIYKVIPSSQLPSSRKMEPEDYIKITSVSHGCEMNVDKAIPISSPKATELLQKFDEHPLARTHKFGVIYQQFGQTCEEELFGNVEHPEPLAEFLEMLGEKIELKGFEGYRGGLDVINNQTGQHSIFTEFKDRKIMFHVSTLLPHDQGDTQYVQKKRHIGNDIVVIIFQDANTPFCPNMIRSHFVHSYIVVQVEHPCTDHTVYKVAVTAKDEVPDFGPPLPDPAIFQKGAEFRDWLLMKVLNAEFNCHQASSFKKLATRTRNQLYLHLVEEIAQCIEDVDCALLSRELTSSLECGGAVSPDVNQISRHKKRRRTLTGMFGKKDNPLASPSLQTGSTKRKSISVSPKAPLRLLSLDPNSPVRHMLAGSTPDLMEETEKGSILSLEDGRHSDTKKEKSNIVKKLSTFRRGGSQETSKEKEKRKPKRTVSVNIPRGHSLLDYRAKRNKGQLSPVNKRRHDSSEESSIASGTNLGGSVPFDLPGTVEAANEDRSLQFDPSITNRGGGGSILTLEDVGISMSHHHHMVDVAVQCSPGHFSVTRYSPLSSPRPPSKGEHSRRLHSVTTLAINTSSVHSQSLPGTPIKKRRSQEVFGGHRVHLRDGSGHHSPPVPFLLDESHGNQVLGGVSRDVGGGGQTSGRSSRLSGDQEEKLFYRVESLESVTTETDEMYSSLLQSLDVVSSEVARLKEQNFNLIRENVKFASQNRDLRIKYLSMKDQLATVQQQLKDLNLKISSPHDQSQPHSPLSQD